MTTGRIKVTLTKTTRLILDALAEREDVSKGAVIRRLLLQEAARMKPPLVVTIPDRQWVDR